MKRTYQATWDRLLHIVSWGVVLVSVMAFVAVLFFGEKQLAWKVGVLVLLLATSIPFTIRGYSVDDHEIGIRRLFWTTRIKRDGLTGAEVIPDAMRGSLRTCGNGGLFSFTGWYWSKKLRAYRAYVTHRHNTVVLRFPNRTIVVSPDDPERFAEDLNGKEKTDAG